MRSTKHVVTQICFYDRTGIQKMMEKQAAKGWMLEEIHNFTLQYRRVEPKKLHFAVTYYPKASMFDPQPSGGEELYREYAAHSGWQFVTSNAQMQIFCSDAEDPIPIETDPLVELENIHKAAKKSYLSSYFLLLFCASLNLGLMIWRLIENFTGTLVHNSNLFTISCWTILFCMECWEICSYYIWRRKAIKAARLDGSFVETSNRNPVMWLILAVVGVGYLLLLTSITTHAVYLGLVVLGLMAGAVVLVLSFTRWMKKSGFSRADNRAFTVMATVFISLAVAGLSTFAVVTLMDNLPDEHIRENYAHNGMTITRFGDELPLTVEDLTGEDDGDYSCYRTEESSILIDRLIANQYRKFGTGDGSNLRYVVVDVKCTPLFDACLREYLTMYHNQKMTDIFGNEFFGEFYPIDPDPWGADRAWQLHRLEEETEYLLVYGNRIVNFEFGKELNQGQMALVADILGNEQNFENNKNN